MKKIIALFLSVILIIGCGIISVSAQNTKIRPELQAVLDKSEPDNVVGVYITYMLYPKTVADMPSWPDTKAAREEYKGYQQKIQREVQAEIFDNIDVRLLFDSAPDFVIAALRVSDIPRVASYDSVREISYWKDVPAEPETVNLFFDEFKAQYDYDAELLPLYEELFYHYNGSDEVDWALIHVESLLGYDTAWNDIIGNRLMMNGTSFYPFESGYGIYDVQQGVFVPVDSKMANDYDGLARVFDEVGSGRLFGDLDGDNEISVVDATLIQRCEAHMGDYPEDDFINYIDLRYNKCPSFYSDFNRDGERDVLDATCIQRYLAGMSYPVG